MNERAIRIVIADDHGVVREGIRHILEDIAGVTVVAEAENGTEALALVEKHAPDVIVLDITMPGLSGLEVAARVRELAPATRILVLSMHDHAEYVLGAVRAGAHGYILKSAGPAEIRQAVRAVHAGHEYFTARVAHHLGAALRGEAASPGPDDPAAALTPREREVL
ncbi:MAG: response regulator, partial [Longimicrobiales bacterium]